MRNCSKARIPAYEAIGGIMDKDYEQIMLKLEALELELREFRRLAKAVDSWVQNSTKVMQEHEMKIKRLERVIIPKIAEDV